MVEEFVRKVIRSDIGTKSFKKRGISNAMDGTDIWLSLVTFLSVKKSASYTPKKTIVHYCSIR